MKASARASCHTTLYLEKHEEFRAENDKGLPFNVRTVSYSGGDTVLARGFAVLVNGDPGAIQREKTVPINSLRSDLKELILRDHGYETHRLYIEVFAKIKELG